VTDSKSIVFSKGTGNAKPDKFLHGGKGAGLIAMGDLGLNIPPGIIIPVFACKEYEGTPEGDHEFFMDKIMEDIEPNLKWLAAINGGRLPLLSIRSGAPVSMPGMMDTILNVGAITEDATVETYWLNKLGTRTTYDCQRRLIEMLGTTAYNFDPKVFADIRGLHCEKNGVESERDFTSDQLRELVARYLVHWKTKVGDEFPGLLYQLRASIEAVFESWNSERAIEYRKLNSIPDYGTAVTIQTMVFGNLNEKSGTGVLFSRNPSTGEGGIFGEYLVNAQGEDVVAGTATPLGLHFMAMFNDQPHWQAVYDELEQTCIRLEAHYGDMVDVEFTVQDGELFILQSRVGKRSALAAFVIAHDMVEGGLITKTEAFSRLTREQVITIRLPSIDPSFKVEPTFKGLAACPGVVKGIAVHTSAEAVAYEGACILVRDETSPDDIAGMAKCAGILTRTGGATSHAAVVARAMDKPCVCGATSMVLDDVHGQVTIDGSTGNVWVGIDVPLVAATDSPIVREVMKWAVETNWERTRVDEPTEGATVLSIGDRWYHPEKLSSLLGELASLDCEGIILDCWLPVFTRDLDDKDLDRCFGVEPTIPAQSVIKKFAIELANRRHQLKGLTLAHFPDLGSEVDNEKVKKWGYKIHDAALKAVPAEYALFAAIKSAKKG
jgi:pyruvate,phosphate dikinase